ncbi:CDP-alcohol phosphatidyltransferase family protein [Pseudomaricurvus sp. HS19]|uniref:CDP-alcohol phosphatidyltransferase family protein n=1 Tax=Pseudomaricurvus sp. HS19 TaxID=2692626 RepID=UPI00136A38B6|nr:CDP-alcohol phosphatidyltransferase family protein [Pseudomaricurvus sp. HS19]MYM64186.1 CDP-alcohol phosphatidyltransferase [Pseudomaricurvus sp. HS19]
MQSILLTPPNLVSLLRLLMAPLLLWLALQQHAQLYLLTVVVTIFTDVLDGFLARSLNQITVLGSQLDSWGDFLIYTTLALCTWLLWPELVQDYWAAWLVIVGSFTLPTLVGLVKFGSITSYHTWLVKIAVACTILSYLLLCAGLLQWPIWLAAGLCLLAATEEIAITLTLRHKRADIRSILQLRQTRDP